MLKLIMGALVWLAGSVLLPGQAWAAAEWFKNGEDLNYRVYWGPLSLGKASLAYTPGPGAAYALHARVKGSIPFFKMDDSWSATGTTSKKTLISRQYRAIQAENDYRANKRLTFNHTRRIMLYENLHDPSEPKLKVALPRGAQDPFTALYDLRRSGAPAQAVTRQVMGLKRPFTLAIGAATPVTRNGRQLLKVEIVKADPQKPGTETWQVLLSNDAELTPIEIEARLKVGSFRAVLEQHPASLPTTAQKEHPIP